MNDSKTGDFWKVKSFSKPGFYLVRHPKPGEWKCSCRAFSRGNGKWCKHIIAAQGWFIANLAGTFDNPAIISVPIPPPRKKRSKDDEQDGCNSTVSENS